MERSSVFSSICILEKHGSTKNERGKVVIEIFILVDSKVHTIVARALEFASPPQFQKHIRVSDEPFQTFC